MTSLSASTAGVLHNRLVFGRRVQVLSQWFAKVIPHGARVLDVGCGDGLISAVLQSKRPDIGIRGIDVLPRTAVHIPVEMFDGSRFPYDDSSFDFVLFSDVLHHTEDPAILLLEARRIASQGIVIKDHYRKGIAAGARLRLMDWVGNARFGVALPYNYWAEEQWNRAWKRIGLQPEELITRLGLYPYPANWIFGAQLHFVAKLKKVDPLVQAN